MHRRTKKGPAGFLCTNSSSYHRPWSRDVVRPRLLQIVEALEGQRTTHGDFRPMNLMIQVAQSGPPIDPLCIGLVDFDWAGVVGQVLYPVIRNEEIHRPGPLARTLERAMTGRCLTTHKNGRSGPQVHKTQDCVQPDSHELSMGPVDEFVSS